MRRVVLTWAFPVLFSLAGAVAVWRSLGSLSVLRHVALHWPAFWAMTVTYVLFTALRGVRFRLLMRSHEPWFKTAEVGFVYSAATNVFPGGLGEFCLPAIYRTLPEGTSRALAALTVSRVQDLLSWLPFLAVGFFLSRLPAAAFLLLPISLLGTAAAALFVFVSAWRNRILTLIARIPHPRLRPFLKTFDERLDDMVRNTPAWGATFLLRLLSVFNYFFVLHFLGLEVGLGAAAVGGALVALLLALPIQGIAGLGTVEVWWISVLHLYGVPLPAAALGAIGLHVSTLVLSLMLGLIPFLGSRSLRLERLVTS